MTSSTGVRRAGTRLAGARRRTSARRRAGARLAAVVLAGALTAPGLEAGQGQPVNQRAAAMNEFRQRVEQYVKFRNEVRSRIPKLEETSEPAEITSRQKALGDALRAARAGARQGDLFTADVAPLLRETVRANFDRRQPEDKRAAIAELPAAVRVGVNDSYPPTIALATVPPTLLAQLPALPETMEYRLVGDRLILRDADANLVVDYIPGAVPTARSR